MRFGYKDKDGNTVIVEVVQVFESEEKLLDYLHAQSPTQFHIREITD